MELGSSFTSRCISDPSMVNGKAISSRLRLPLATAKPALTLLAIRNERSPLGSFPSGTNISVGRSRVKTKLIHPIHFMDKHTMFRNLWESIFIFLSTLTNEGSIEHAVACQTLRNYHLLSSNLTMPFSITSTCDMPSEVTEKQDIVFT